MWRKVPKLWHSLFDAVPGMVVPELISWRSAENIDFFIKVSKLALYPGHTLGGAPSVSKPELAGVPEGCVRCGTKRITAHGHVCWLLAIGITNCQASQARWWELGSAPLSFSRPPPWSKALV